MLLKHDSYRIQRLLTSVNLSFNGGCVDYAKILKIWFSFDTKQIVQLCTFFLDI